MIKFLSTIFLLLFAASVCYSGLPPTTSKVSTDANNVTTFNYQFPNFTGTHTGTTVSLGVNGIAGGGTNNGSLAVTAGGVLYTDGSKVVNVGAGTSGYYLISGGSGAPTWTNVSPGTTPPKITTYASSSGTWNKTGSPIYIRVRIVGGGGGGGGGGSSGGTGTAGNPSTFGSTLLSAGGGGAGSLGSGGAAGGTSSLGTGPVGSIFTGGAGGAGAANSATINIGGGVGGASMFGGGGPTAVGGNATAGGAYGSGGGGGGCVNTISCGGGGGAGGGLDAVITSPASSYLYSVGTGGAGGSGNVTSGAAGHDGYIEVTEYYQ